MKFFDIVAGEVVIHPDALAIPCFHDIWTSSSDKKLVFKYISYIVLNNHPDSPYVVAMDPDSRKSKILSKLFGDESYKLDESIILAEIEYVEFMDTLSLQMLRGIRTNLEIMAKSLLVQRQSDMTFRDMKELLDMSTKAEKAIKSIKALEEQVRKDEISTVRSKGGSEVSHYEMKR